MQRTHCIRRIVTGVIASIVVLAASAAVADAESITVTHWGDAFYGAPYAVAM
jgi:NitT/TauT family transport system substrate-binding protein